MAVYDMNKNPIATLYSINGNSLDAAYDVHGNLVWNSDSIQNDGIQRTIKNATNYPDPLGFRVGEEYVETFVAKDGYTLEGAAVSVVMDGEDITDSVYTMGAVVIDHVSEDLSIWVEAAKINYVIPPASDFKLELYNGKQAIRGYKGAESAIEIPPAIEVDGKMYETCIYYPGIPETVVHLKLSCSVPAYGSLQGMCSGITDKLKTFWNNTGVDLYFGTGVNAERLISPDQTNATKTYTPNNHPTITTMRQMKYPTAVTSGATLFYGDTALVDAGTIPAWWKNLRFAFSGCSSLRRVAIDARGVTDHGNWFGAKPSCKVKLHPDSETFRYMRDMAARGSGSGYAQPIMRLYPYDETEEIHTILCIGDSLTRGTGSSNSTTKAYPVKLLEKLSANTIVYNEGMGSTKTGWHRDKLLNEANTPYLSDALVILWTGTNGNTDGDNTVETLELLIEEMISAMGSNRKFLLIPAVAEGISDSRNKHLAHKQWCIDQYGADHVFDVYDWFDSQNLTRSDYMADSLHYNDEGYAIIADGIYEKLNANGWVTPA